MKIVIGSDHAGFEYKSKLIDYLVTKQQVVEDMGTKTNVSCDYPDYAHQVAQRVSKDPNVLGILICGSANGVAITANKYANVRAVICWNKEVTILARQHNDANVLCLPARFITEKDMIEFYIAFVATAFEAGRHANRVQKINRA